MRWTYIAQADIFHKRRINLRLCDDFLHELVDEAVERRVFEAAFAGFCEGRADGEGDDDVVGVLRRSTIYCVSLCSLIDLRDIVA